MNGMIAVDERNQDDMPHKAGCYLYAGTRLWLDDNIVHRSGGPAVIFPDGAGRWYIRGKEMTRSVRNYFFQNKWPIEHGFGTPEKRALFSSHFLK